MRDLAPTTGSQVYETWVISGENAPVPVGGFAVGSTGQAAFTTQPSPAPAGATIALTLEPQAGAKAPTLPIVSVGKAVGGTSG
jgi:anti-sigma-K factor RskA